MILNNQAGRIKSNFDLHYTIEAFKLYESFNSNPFRLIQAPDYWKDLATLIRDTFHMGIVETHKAEQLKPAESDKIIVAFSGGLDSAYQALYLRDHTGLEVHLLHVANLNRYSNGQELKVAKQFALDNNLPLEIVNFSSRNGDKAWNENPFKTSLANAIALDYALHLGTNLISSGDDLRLTLDKADLNNNIGDSIELTRLFFKNLSFTLIPIREATKDKRLQYLYETGNKDSYYSCVGAGRLNKSLHNHWEDKYSIQLDAHSCGSSCRKCAMHCLQEHYYLDIDYPEEFIDKCWSKLAIGPDAVFFNKKLSLEDRVRNLRDY